MNKIIGEVQSAFIKDRFILDGVLVINEVVEFIKKSRKRCLIFKVDFEKAYDSESLNVAMQEVVQGGLFDGVKVGSDGLKVNLNKSTLFGIGVEMEEVEGWATSLRCSLKAMNWALLAKWWWRFRFERDAFWVKVIKSLYGEGGGTVGQSLSGSGYSVWRNIIKVGNDLDKIGIHLSSSFEWEVGSGNAIMFWEDNWIGMGKLRDLFPRLYHLDVVNDAILGNKGFWREDEWVWNWVWRSDLRGRAITDMYNLSNLVQDIQLKKDTKDKCKWRLNDGGSFTVKGLRDMVDSKILEASGIIFETSWCKFIPKKVCIFVWRLYHRRIPVRVVLYNMGMRNIFSVEDVLNLAQANIFTGIKREIWKGIVWSVLYFIWTFRNQVVFKGNESKILDLFKEVQGRAFEWIAARMKKDHLKWEDWISGLIVPSRSM
ncbi:hypothetical protein Tco_1009991 [Tanacetum coccineum]